VTLQRDPDNVRARAVLAIALAQSGEREVGIAQIERTLTAAPDDGRVRYNAACTFVHAGLPERAIEELGEMVKGMPSHLADWPRNDPDLASLRDHPKLIRMFGWS
jgi:adenylate cyclase